MIKYIEHKNASYSYFEKKIIDENGLVVTRTVHMPLYQKEKDNFLYFVLYNDSGEVVHDFYSYVNHTMKNQATNSRIKAAKSLRLLYCFLSLSNYDIRNIDSKAFGELLVFLRGLGVTNSEDELSTLRCANTVNGYLSVYRSYFNSRNIKCAPLFSSTTVQAVSPVSDSQVSRSVYKNNLRTSHVNDNLAPKYISPDEFRRIYKLMIDRGDQTAQLIVHLMYGYGLRLGEVLGITMEDIQEIRENNALVPVVMIRNRVSDEIYQSAKNLMHVTNSAQYRLKDYQSSKHKIIITYDLYEKLISYIEEYHSYFIEKYPDNYSKTKADIVSLRNAPESNHYVFLNKNGKILSNQTWGRHLKHYFELANIPTDKDVRDANLSHRFRHGFAMFHARFSDHPVDALVLQKMMRHRNLSSTMVYYNPTAADEFEIKTAFQEDLYAILPELRGGFINGS